MRFAEKLEEYRIRVGRYASNPREPFGAFELPGPCGERLTIIACDGDVKGELSGWEHVSVSTRRRIPNWTEMCFVKDLFWQLEECVVQYHPPHSQYVNNYSRVLHLWRPRDGVFPMPPSILVGVKQLGELA
jgi:hypothetical protein